MSKPTDHEPRRPAFLKSMVVMSFVVIVICVIAQVGIEQIREMFPFYETAFANLICLIGGVLLFLGWCGWLLFFSRKGFLVSKLLPITLVVGLCVSCYFYRPVNGGGMGIVGFECIYAKRNLDPINATGEAIQVRKATDSDFWQFFGPNRNGIVEAPQLSGDWKTNQPEVLWKVDIGESWAGFVAVGDNAFTIEQRDEKEVVTCRKIESGDIVWAYEQSQRHEAPLGGVGPRSTPCYADGKLLVHGGTGTLLCLDAGTGKLIWEKSIPELVGISFTEKTTAAGVPYQVENSNLMWGRAASPMVVNDLVIIPGGGPTDGAQVTLFAFSINDGKEVWRGGDLPIGYASPTLMKFHGVEQVVLTTESKVASFDPQDGKMLWAFDREGNSTQDAQSSQPVYIDDGSLILTKGYGLGGELIEIQLEQGKWSALSKWKSRRVLQTKFTNAIKKGNYVYGISDGVLECIDIGTGKRVWRNLRVGHGQMLIAGDYLLVQTHNGSIVLADAKPEWLEERGRIKRLLKGRCWNTMCLQGEYLLVRSEKQAACIKLPTKTTQNPTTPDSDASQ